MPSLRQLNLRIKSVQTTTKLTKAMQAVAAMRLRKLTKQAAITNAYKSTLQSIYDSLSVSASLKQSTSPYFALNLKASILFVVISPTRGFCGGLHRTVVTQTYQKIKQLDLDSLMSDQVKFVTVGRPAQKMVAKLGGNIVASFNKNYKEISAYTLLPIAELVNQVWIQENIKEVIIVYAESSASLHSTIVFNSILPFVVNDNSAIREKNIMNLPNDVNPLIDNFAPQWIQMQIHNAVVQTRTSEEGARMVAMNQATDNAKRLSDKLKLSYFRLRQAKITQEISEIVGGSL